MSLQSRRFSFAAWLIACPVLASAGSVLPADPFAAAAPAAPQLHAIEPASEAVPVGEALPPPPPLQLRRIEKSRPLTRIETETGDALSLRRADFLASLPIAEVLHLHPIAPSSAEAIPATAAPTPVRTATPSAPTVSTHTNHGPHLRTIAPVEPSLTE